MTPSTQHAAAAAAAQGQQYLPSLLLSLIPNSSLNTARLLLPQGARAYPRAAAAAATLLAYLALQRVLRYRRRDAFWRRYAEAKRREGRKGEAEWGVETGHDDGNGTADGVKREGKRGKKGDEEEEEDARELLSRMTLDDAWPILRDMTELEFPSVFKAAVFFALFKTYGIPTISSLLTKTGQLASPATASKRATDTGVLIGEFVLNHPDSSRRLDGVARMNFLHEKYRRSGKILDADMLYTLSLFALEPARWTAKYDWRGLTDVERAALGTFWRDMGGMMGIPEKEYLEPFWGLEGGGKGEERYDDGLAWLEALDRWSRRYEEENMVPADSNEAVSRSTLDIALFNTPDRMKPGVLAAISAALEPRLRDAMRLPHPSPTTSTLVLSLLRVRALVVRHLHLPRPAFMKRRLVTDKPDPATGRYHVNEYLAHPWYVRPTLWTRWLSPEALRTRFLFGGVLPGDERRVESGGASGTATATATATEKMASNNGGDPALSEVDAAGAAAAATTTAAPTPTKRTKTSERMRQRGSHNSHYHPEGYLIAELGPESMVGKGAAEMEEIKRQLLERKRRKAVSEMGLGMLDRIVEESASATAAAAAADGDGKSEGNGGMAMGAGGGGGCPVAPLKLT